MRGFRIASWIVRTSGKTATFQRSKGTPAAADARSLRASASILDARSWVLSSNSMAAMTDASFAHTRKSYVSRLMRLFHSLNYHHPGHVHAAIPTLFDGSRATVLLLAATGPA